MRTVDAYKKKNVLANNIIPSSNSNDNGGTVSVGDNSNGGCHDVVIKVVSFNLY